MMLIEEFSFGNYRSFKEIQTLRMHAAKIVSGNKALDTRNVIPVNDKTKLLKSKVIYGANASGKSNVLRALFVFVGFIRFNLRENSLMVMESFRYSTETLNEPCYFQMIFYIDGVKYRYGFEVSTQRVHTEWLFLTHNVREVPIFIRNGQEIEEISQKYLPKGYEISKMKNKMFTEKVLFLSLVENFGDKLAEEVVHNISSISFFFSNEIYRSFDDILYEKLKEKDFLSNAIRFLKYADIGLDNVEILKPPAVIDEETEEKGTLYSVHKVYDENLKKVSSIHSVFEHTESDGTKQMFRLSPFLSNSLAKGIPLFIDEFGSQLHPLLTKKIFSMYNTDENRQSQIVVTSHSTELMSSDLLRKDQIDFVEKDRYSRSYLYTLVEIKGVRNNASFESDYFKGKYGAVPFLGNWGELEKICDKTAEEHDKEE